MRVHMLVRTLVHTLDKAAKFFCIRCLSSDIRFKGDTSLNEVTVTGIGMTSQRTRDRLIQRLRDEGVRDERVLTVMRNIPRHLFVDEALAHRAYEDTALPIGHYQTLSQPYIVARMTEVLMAGGPLKKVLESVLAPATRRLFWPN